MLSNLAGARLLGDRIALSCEDVRVAMSTIEDRALQRIADGRWRVKISERKPAERLELRVGAEDAGRPVEQAGTTRDPMTALRRSRPTSRSTQRDPAPSERGAWNFRRRSDSLITTPFQTL